MRPRKNGVRTIKLFSVCVCVSGRGGGGGGRGERRVLKCSPNRIGAPENPVLLRGVHGKKRKIC